MAGLVAPNNFPIRKVTDSKQDSPYIYNTPRYPDHGGFTDASKLEPSDSVFKVEAPTRIRSAKPASKNTD